MAQWFAVEGSPAPLGLTWLEKEHAFNFAIYSKHATDVHLLLYSEADVTHPIYEYRLDPYIHKSGRVWHFRLKLSAIPKARYYAYRMDGPNETGMGNCFDSAKILLDPYAKAVFFPPHFSREAACIPGSNAGRAPLAVLISESAFSWNGDLSPVHTSDTVIYELHVRGFTMRPNSGISAEKRGTFAGVVEKIPYLKELGVTVVELMPVPQQDPQEGSGWGYMPLNFFSPNNAYASAVLPEDVSDEFRTMVKALHSAGIEVILDAVYNHTTESDELGPTYNFRGIDNSTYYLLQSDWQHYRNDTGAGNTLHCDNRAVRKMIIDALYYWVTRMHVDGFRFDLASIFTRNDDGSINTDDPPVVIEISSAPRLERVRLIAEAWDPTVYQLGRSFPGLSWLQWNGKFRDDIRSFVKGDPGCVTALMTRIYGSDDLFPDDVSDAYHPFQSVNFITCHDGFCLYDLVSYDNKHNQANGNNSTDGSDSNFSWNCGWEGEDGVPPEVIELRRRQVLNFCCLLFLSNGTPMFRAGDEFMNTQRGNNNPYNQDNETTWLNWKLLETNRDVFRFFKYMIAFRKSHPTLSRSRFWKEDVRWYGVSDRPDLSYNSHALAFYLSGASQQDDDLYVMVNAYWEDLTFAVQEGKENDWYRVVDTSQPSPFDFLDPGTEQQLRSPNYILKSRSIAVLIHPRK